MPTTKKSRAKRTSKKSATARKTTTSRSAASRNMNVVTFLKKEHDTVERLMARFEKTTAPRQQEQLSQRICTELLVHAEMEEKSFYPEMERVPEVADLVKEGYEEHHKVETIIHQVQPMEQSAPRFMALMQELEKNVKHHVEEEEQEMFPKVQKACEHDYLMELTKILKKTKTAVKREMKATEMPGERRVREDVAAGELAKR
jgi:hemerythrin superfamily protein